MRFVFATTLRMVIAFNTGLLSSLFSNHLLNWPCGLPILLSLLLGMFGMLRIGEWDIGPMLGWLLTSNLVWLGLELPILIYPQLVIITTSGCLVGCDGGPNAVYPAQHTPATFPEVLIGFLLGLLAIEFVIGYIALIVVGIRESRTKKQ